MRPRYSVLLAALALAACTMPPPPPPSMVIQIPPNFYGNWIDLDLGAVNDSSYAFGSPDILRNDPVAAVRAIIAVEYLAVETDSPRWVAVPPLTKMNLVQARDEIRRTIGVAPAAPPPVVINAELRLLHDLVVHDMADARQVIAPPVFVLPADQTLALLANLPPLPITHAATQQAENQVMLLH